MHVGSTCVKEYLAKMFCFYSMLTLNVQKYCHAEFFGATLGVHSTSQE